MNTNYNVVIVGGGAAGLMLARELGKFKQKTLVLERKKELLNFSFKTLGSFINLEEFGLSKNVVAQKIDTIGLYSENVKRTIKTEKIFKEDVEIGTYILDKELLHKELLESIDKNYVDFKTGVYITDIIKNNEGNYSSVKDKKGNSYSATIIVDASGTVGVLSKNIGLQSKKVKHATGLEFNVKYKGKPDEAHLFIGKTYKGGYGWIFPLKNKRAIVGFGTFDNDKIGNLKKEFEEILETPKIKNLVEKDNNIAEGGSIPLTPVLKKFIDKNLICVGDSVSQVNPIVGEGYKFIFESAIMASKAINDALKENNFQKLCSYEEIWKSRFYKNYVRSKKKQDLLINYSKNDFLMDLTMFLLNLRPNIKNIKSLSGEYEYNLKK